MLNSIPLLIFYFDEADHRYEEKGVESLLCCDEEFLTCYGCWAVVFREGDCVGVAGWGPLLWLSDGKSEMLP